MSLDKIREEQQQMELVKEMSFPKYEYQPVEGGSWSIKDTKGTESEEVFEGLRNLTASE